MIDVRLYSFLILAVFMIVLIIGYGLVFLLRPKSDGVSAPISIFIYYCILSVIIFFVLMLVLIFVRSSFFNQTQEIQLRLESVKNNILPLQPIVGTPVSPVTPVAPVTPAPINPSPITPSIEEKPPTTAYYAYNPSTNTLELLDLDKVTFGKQILDTYHRNDESIFVLDDGIVTILGDEMSRYTQGIPIKKVRVLNGEYIGLANGKIYKSKDLANWVEDNTKPNNILDIDVPFEQDRILFIQTPNENLLIDSITNQVLAKDSSEFRKYGSNVNSFIRKTNDGIYVVNDGMQSLYKGYNFGDINNRNRFLVIPNSLKDGYEVVDAMNLDDKLLVKVETKTDKPEAKLQVNNLIYR
jgi:hypothetical protein